MRSPHDVPWSFWLLIAIALWAASSGRIVAGDLYGDPLLNAKLAARYGRMEELRAWIEEFPDVINQGDELGYTPLHYAAMGNQPDAVKLLISKGAKIDSRDEDQGTPLYAAAHKGCLDAAKVLVRLGADPNTQKNNFGNHGQSVLGAAARDGNIELVTFLLCEGATIVYDGGRGRDTALHWAAWGNRVRRDGKAIALSNSDIIDLLAKRIGDINIRNWSRDTPLHKAAQMGAVATVRHILRTYPEADVNAEDRYGNTPFHEAFDSSLDRMVTGKEQAAIAELLLEHGAKRDIQNNRGKTPLDLAREINSLVVLERLDLWKPVKAPRP